MSSETEDIRYKTSDGARKYRYPGKKQGYPSVTSVIGSAWPSGHLEDWRIGNIAAQCVANADTMRKRFGGIAKKPEKYRELHIPALREQFIEWKDDFSAADRGTRIHAGVEAVLQGCPVDAIDSTLNFDREITQDLAPDETASVQMALAALDRLGVEAEHVEAPVFNHAPKYAGTADIIGTFKRVIRGRERRVRAVIDLKTGKRVSKAYGPQLAAYAMASELLVGGEMKPMPRVHLALVLHVRPDSAQFFSVDIQEGWEDFLACHRIHASSTSKRGMSRYEQSHQ